MSRDHFEFCGFKVPDISTDTLAGLIADKFPQVWRRTYTKHYDAPGVYRSFKYVAVQFSMGLIGEAMSKVKDRELVSNVPVLFKILEEYDWPTYHVHAPMFDAMRRTHPPTSKTWDDIRLPYPGVIFMLPKGSLYMPKIDPQFVADSERVPIVYIGITRISRERFKFKSEFGESDGKDRMCVFWSADGPDGPISHDCAFPVSQALEPDPKWIDEATIDQERSGFASEATVDGSYTAALAGVIANLLLLREARPEYVEAGGRTRRALRNGTTIHAPTFIGHKYVVRREASVKGDSAHMRFTEIGWRAGHMKEQPCGPRLAERKTIWVEPYMAHVRGLMAEKGQETASVVSK